MHNGQIIYDMIEAADNLLVQSTSFHKGLDNGERYRNAIESYYNARTAMSRDDVRAALGVMPPESID